MRPADVLLLVMLMLLVCMHVMLVLHTGIVTMIARVLPNVTRILPWHSYVNRPHVLSQYA